MIALGVVICIGSYFAARTLARRWLRLPGVRTLSKQADESYFQAPRGRRIVWRLAGPATAYALSVVLAFLALRVSGEPVATTRVVVRDDRPAGMAGMRTGDRIVSIDGVTPSDWPDVQRRVAAVGPGRPVSISIRRDQATLSFTVTTNAEGRIGLMPFNEMVPKPFGRALREAAPMPITTAVETARTWWSDLVEVRQTDLSGPVAIAHALPIETDSANLRERFVLMLLAYPTALVWPMSLFVELLLTPRRRRPVG